MEEQHVMVPPKIVPPITIRIVQNPDLNIEIQAGGTNDRCRLAGILFASAVELLSQKGRGILLANGAPRTSV